MLKSEGIFLICNESDGTNAADEKWTKMINGMKIYTSKQLVAALIINLMNKMIQSNFSC